MRTLFDLISSKLQPREGHTSSSLKAILGHAPHLRGP